MKPVDIDEFKLKFSAFIKGMQSSSPSLLEQIDQVISKKGTYEYHSDEEFAVET